MSSYLTAILLIVVEIVRSTHGQCYVCSNLQSSECALKLIKGIQSAPPSDKLLEILKLMLRFDLPCENDEAKLEECVEYALTVKSTI